MPKFIASLEVWFDADSLTDAEVVSDEMGDSLMDWPTVSAVTNGASEDHPEPS